MNLKRLKEQTGADEERLQLYISLFNEMLPQYVVSIKKGLNEGDTSLIHDAVHSSKTLLQTLGFDKLYGTAEEIEQLIKSKETYNSVKEKVQTFLLELDGLIN